MTTPCLDCADRCIKATESGIQRCHSWCGKYLDWQKANEQDKRKRGQMSESDALDNTRGTRYYFAR